MQTQFIRKFYDPTGGLGAFTPVGLVTSGIQTVLGIVQAISGSAKAKKFQQMLEPFKTPDEVYKILDATKNLSSQGFDPATLNYLTSNVDEAFASSASIAKRLGADANTLSNLFSDRINAVMKIGADNHALNMENFSKYLGALDTVASNKAAEQKSKQDLIKDQIQAAVADKQAGLQNIGGGINTGLSTISANESGKLFTKGINSLSGSTSGVSNDLLNMLIKQLVGNSAINSANAGIINN